MKLALWGSRINANKVCALVQILVVCLPDFPCGRGIVFSNYIFFFLFLKFYLHKKQKNLSEISGVLKAQ